MHIAVVGELIYSVDYKLHALVCKVNVEVYIYWMVMAIGFNQVYVIVEEIQLVDYLEAVEKSELMDAKINEMVEVQEVV